MSAIPPVRFGTVSGKRERGACCATEADAQPAREARPWRVKEEEDDSGLICDSGASAAGGSRRVANDHQRIPIHVGRQVSAELIGQSRYKLPVLKSSACTSTYPPALNTPVPRLRVALSLPRSNLTQDPAEGRLASFSRSGRASIRRQQERPEFRRGPWQLPCLAFLQPPVNQLVARTAGTYEPGRSGYLLPLPVIEVPQSAPPVGGSLDPTPRRR